MSMNSGYSMATLYAESAYCPARGNEQAKRGNSVSILTCSAVRL